MKPVFSKHALAQMEQRDITKDRILTVITSPDTMTKQGNDILIYSKLVNDDIKDYLYRVFVNHLKEPELVITACKTSKIKKYGY